MSAQWYDANISLPGCDKNMPGTIMAMARLNRPSLMIYGGTAAEEGQHAPVPWARRMHTTGRAVNRMSCIWSCHRGLARRCWTDWKPALPGRPAAGTIKPGHSKLGGNDTLDIVSAFQSFGGYTAGLINEDQVGWPALPSHRARTPQNGPQPPRWPSAAPPPAVLSRAAGAA